MQKTRQRTALPLYNDGGSSQEPGSTRVKRPVLLSEAVQRLGTVTE